LSDSILIFHFPITFPYISKSNSTCCAHTVPLLTRRLTALRVFIFYFLISNLVAVILRFLEGGFETKLGTWKKYAPPLYVHFPTPWNWRHVHQFRRVKVGAVAVLFLWLYQKKGPVLKNQKKNSRKTSALIVFSKRWRISQSSF
jgi:hypothetical protein